MIILQSNAEPAIAFYDDILRLICTIYRNGVLFARHPYLALGGNVLKFRGQM